MKRIFVLLSILGLTSIANAHAGHHHSSQSGESKLEAAPTDIKIQYQKINQEYGSAVKPIFESKCAACHSNSISSPWYSKIPGISWLIESDKLEAKKHLEISSGFPFAGHGTPLEDLEAIKNSINKNTMPTRLYLLFHSSSRLTNTEKTQILSWVDQSESAIYTFNSEGK